MICVAYKMRSYWAINSVNLNSITNVLEVIVLIKSHWRRDVFVKKIKRSAGNRYESTERKEFKRSSWIAEQWRFWWISLDPVCRLPGKPGTRESGTVTFPPALGTTSALTLTQVSARTNESVPRGIYVRDE